jgi:hypothetical protein
MYSGQRLPQLPQFVQSVNVLVHCVPVPRGQIALSPEGQQLALTQTSPAAQAKLQEPQLYGSVCGLLHAPAQNCVSPGLQQAPTGVPLLTKSKQMALSQALPQKPQLLESPP